MAAAAAAAALPAARIGDFSDTQETYVKECKSWEKAQSRKSLGQVTTLASANGHNGKPVKIIAVYNFKGGVGKTTNTINLAAALSKNSQRVVVVDADPQCNATNFFQPPANVAQADDDDDAYGPAAAAGGAAGGAGAGKRNPKKRAGAAAAGAPQPVLPVIEEHPLPRLAASAIQMDYMRVTDERMYAAGIDDLYTLLSPPFDGKGYDQLVPPAKLLAIDGVPNMWLVPGSPLLPKLESQLSLVAANKQTASVFLGAFGLLFKGIAQVTKADFILVDLSPSMSLLNKMILMSCHYILPPMFADFFSLSSMHTLLSEMVPMLMEDHEEILKEETGRLTASQKAFGYSFNPHFPQILPFIVTNFGKKEVPKGSGMEYVVKNDADWIVSMKEICNPQRKFITSKVLALFVPAGGGKMVVPLMQKYDALNALSHSYGHPACLMDRAYFNNVVVPGENAARPQGTPLKFLAGYSAFGFEMADKLLRKYTTLVTFLKAI